MSAAAFDALSARAGPEAGLARLETRPVRFVFAAAAAGRAALVVGLPESLP